MAMSPYCRVKRVPVGTELKAGTLLAINGCWQNKAEIAYINMVCVHDQKPYAAYSSFNADSWAEFAVGIRTLGRFYADGREQPSKAKPVREHSIIMPVKDGKVIWDHHNFVRSWAVVMPIEGAMPKQIAVVKSPSAIQNYTAPPKSPEAILADFAA